MARGADGFSLIEVIVSLVILSGALAAAYSGLGQSWRAQRIVERSATALRIAESVLATAGSETPLADGQSFAGESEGIAWRLSVEKRVAEDAAAEQGPAAYWLVVDAEWPVAGRRQPQNLHLRSLKLAPAAGIAP